MNFIPTCAVIIINKGIMNYRKIQYAPYDYSELKKGSVLKNVETGVEYEIKKHGFKLGKVGGLMTQLKPVGGGEAIFLQTKGDFGGNRWEIVKKL